MSGISIKAMIKANVRARDAARVKSGSKVRGGLN
jgi:hypothetical protein